jgi:hypothetical protein
LPHCATSSYIRAGIPALPCAQETEYAQLRELHTRPLTLIDGFYAVMGGYVVDLPAPEEEKSSIRRSTLTPEGILELARNNIFQKVSHKTIEDKSKADLLAKFLVCFQVSFLVVQVS